MVTCTGVHVLFDKYHPSSQINIPCKNVNTNTMFTHGEPRSGELGQKCPCIPGSNWNVEMWFLRRKTSQSRVENQQQTQPTYIV